ncbi:hypothetical protein J3Q64DRAFT_1762271 [Phycomyces blakesleeanus]|uniref:Pyridoxamine 5'-phosphate oxidase Alr4036 family FMN-binding domain-containing protein n=1 Tax=Phycomyces blakesleeanus TaxID=4837 RepID=A0ABR3APJ8_PHYBL
MSFSLPSSPTSPTLHPQAPPPWHYALRTSYTLNYPPNTDKAYLTMANIKRSGETSMHSLAFQSFVDEDARFLTFLLAMNNNSLMGDIRSDPQAKLCWMMPKSKEQYHFSGKFYIASSPTQVTRFPPPKVSDQLPAAVYWETERRRQWSLMSNRTRASFTWPSQGEVPKADRLSFSCQSLDCMMDKEGPRIGVAGTPEEMIKVVHDIAMDNFCLLAYKVTRVGHFDHSVFPPKRTIYTYSLKTNAWSVQDANP